MYTFLVVAGLAILVCSMMAGGSAVANQKGTLRILGAGLLTSIFTGAFGGFCGFVACAVIHAGQHPTNTITYAVVTAVAFCVVTMVLPVHKAITGKCVFRAWTEVSNSPDGKTLSKAAIIGGVAGIMLNR
jgi:hypothetical protein